MARSSFYPDVGLDQLKWRVRKLSIQHSIEGIMSDPSTVGPPPSYVGSLPDILCLQEVDFYEKKFKALLQGIGYESKHKTRSGSLRTAADGSLVAYNSKRFDFVSKVDIDFNGLTEVPELKKLSHRLKQNNVAIICVLRDTSTGGFYIVVSAHLFYNPKFTEVKVLQAVHLLDRIDKMISRSPEKKYLGLIIGADLNSLPNSCVYKIFTQGKLVEDSVEYPEMPLEAEKYVRNTLHNLKHVPFVTSAYKFAGDYEREDLVTTFSLEYKGWKEKENRPEFYGVIDYIFWRRFGSDDQDEASAPVVSTLKLPSLTECKNMPSPVGFPRDNYPSDHLPVAAKFDF